VISVTRRPLALSEQIKAEGALEEALYVPLQRPPE